MKLNDIDKKDVVATIKGSTGNSYDIYELPDKTLVCSCPARIICKHIKEYVFKRDWERELTDMEYRGIVKEIQTGMFKYIVDKVCQLRKESL